MSLVERSLVEIGYNSSAEEGVFPVCILLQMKEIRGDQLHYLW
jgi:hypothetical protein